jgi:2-methylcitrate dehydratase PrpD
LLHAPATARAAAFAHGLRWDGLPDPVRRQAGLALLDVLGAAIAGSRTPVAGIACEAVRQVWNGDQASILLAGLTATAPGAAFANGCLANALDIDDGYRPVKGHPGAAVFPAALAAAEVRGSSGAAFLAALVAGYEIAMRAGPALHDAYQYYHGSGSWAALGAAAASGALLGLTEDQLTHALGIAEYHGPLAPIMRCVEQPGMVKDGVGWGAATGVSAAQLAGAGFTGLPSIFDVRPAAAEGFGHTYKILDLYFKPHACCRWAQPAIDGIQKIRARHPIDPAAVRRVRLITFDAATRLGPVLPANTEEAQYSLAWPVAAAVVDGWVGPEQVSGARLADPQICDLAQRVEAVVSPDLERRFPAEALCEVELQMDDGTALRSGVCGARGDPSDPLSADELRDKFRRLAEPVIGAARTEAVERVAASLEDRGIEDLLALLRAPGMEAAPQAATPLSELRSRSARVSRRSTTPK